MNGRAFFIVLAAALLAACQKKPPQPQTAAAAAEPAGIAWYSGGVNNAFITAEHAHRPVLLFWGASWCPWCQQLKATVFSRADFIEKSRLFVPVYLDGDDAGAQRWGEEFRVTGYPTLVVLDSERREIMRLAGGMDLSQYPTVLDSALADLQPVDALLAAPADRKLDGNDCRRLAYNAWALEEPDAGAYAERSGQLAAASARCPAEAAVERARLTIFAARFAALAESPALDQGRPPSPRLSDLIDQVGRILGSAALSASVADALQYLDESFFKAVRARGSNVATPLREAFVASMDAASNNGRYAVADQIGALGSKLQAEKLLGDGKLAQSVVTDARLRIDAALAAEHEPYRRSAIIDAALGVFDQIGQNADAYRIVKAEIANSKTPYYFEADLAALAESLGHKDEALRLLDQAYGEAKGAATRFQWGQLYLSGLLRMAPNDSVRIRQVGDEVLGELEGEDRIYRRARLRLEKLDRELHAWNTAARGGHEDVMQSLHARMQQICAKIPQQEPARGSCDAFLRSAA
jgi:thioredoxin-related protein